MIKGFTVRTDGGGVFVFKFEKGSAWTPQKALAKLFPGRKREEAIKSGCLKTW